jgi:hypothetical protein
LDQRTRHRTDSDAGDNCQSCAERRSQLEERRRTDQSEPAGTEVHYSRTAIYNNDTYSEKGIYRSWTEA